MEQVLTAIITGYLILMNLAGFSIMGMDKRKARKNAWRIPERTLLAVAFLGGGIGAFLGMHTFHHKTKHIKFMVSLPIAAGFYLFLIIKLYHVI